VTPSIVSTSELPEGFGFLDLHVHAPDRYPFLLESVGGGAAHGRFDILFAFPGERLCLEDTWKLSGQHAGGNKGFLAALDAWWSSERVDAQPETVADGGAAAASRLPFKADGLIFWVMNWSGKLSRPFSLQRCPDSRLPWRSVFLLRSSVTCRMGKPGW
jgi:anthranilate synthase component 1